MGAEVVGDNKSVKPVNVTIVSSAYNYSAIMIRPLRQLRADKVQ